MYHVSYLLSTIISVISAAIFVKWFRRCGGNFIHIKGLNMFNKKCLYANADH